MLIDSALIESQFPTGSQEPTTSSAAKMDPLLVRVSPNDPKFRKTIDVSELPLDMYANPAAREAKAPLSILRSIEVEQIDSVLFRSFSLWTPAGARGVFGGQVIAQALHAAAMTMNDPTRPWGLHSQHCYFLLAVSSSEPIIYRVKKVRDGRSFSTRTVVASQKGANVFTLTCSFCIPPPAVMSPVSFAIAIPEHVPKPEACELEEIRWQRFLDERAAEGTKLPEDLVRGLYAYIWERRESPIAMIEVPRDVKMRFPADGPNAEPRLMHNYEKMLWMKTRDVDVSGQGENVQKAILGYMSDFQFIGTAAQSLGMSHTSTPRLGMIASLDHTVFFYSTTFKTTDWLLYVITTPRAGEGRGVVHGSYYTPDGDLVAVCVQEGVIRAAPENFVPGTISSML